MIRPLDVIRSDELDDDLREQLDAASMREFGHYGEALAGVWAEPEWTIVARERRTLLASLHVFRREARYDQRAMAIAGIGHVITEPSVRGTGLGRLLMERAHDFALHEKHARAVLLFANDASAGFYARLGYRELVCPVMVERGRGPERWMSRAMQLGGSVPGVIDLRGPPW